MIGLGSLSVISLSKCVLLILARDTPPNSYLRTGVPLIYAFGLSIEYLTPACAARFTTISGL